MKLWFKNLWKDYEAAQQELASTGIFSLPTPYGVFTFFDHNTFKRKNEKDNDHEST